MVTVSWVSQHKQALLVCFSLVVFGFLLLFPIFKEPEKQNCLALLVFASLLWCTEAIPLFVTSMLVPFLIVVLRVLDDVEQEPPARLTPKQAAPAVFHTMFSQVRPPGTAGRCDAVACLYTHSPIKRLTAPTCAVSSCACTHSAALLKCWAAT